MLQHLIAVERRCWNVGGRAFLGHRLREILSCNLVPLAHAQHMAAMVPGATLRVRPGEGHIGNLAAAEEVLDELVSLWQTAGGDAHSKRRGSRS